MQETRRARLQSVILEELSMVVPREVKDPRVPAITFTSVQVTPDGSQATVFVSLLGGGLIAASPETDEKAAEKAEKETRQRMKDCLEGLASASGYLRRHLARVLNVRHVPSLVFKEDRGFENVMRVNELLKQISPNKSDDKK